MNIYSEEFKQQISGGKGQEEIKKEFDLTPILIKSIKVLAIIALFLLIIGS